MIDNNDHYYELKYRIKDYSCVVRFNGDIGGEELKANLKDFLRGCSWTQSTVDRIFNEGETNDD